MSYEMPKMTIDRMAAAASVLAIILVGLGYIYEAGQLSAQIEQLREDVAEMQDDLDNMDERNRNDFAGLERYFMDWIVNHAE